jgi:hypothetical protein
MILAGWDGSRWQSTSSKAPHALVYIALDPAGTWKGSIVKERRPADLDFDSNTA